MDTGHFSVKYLKDEHPVTDIMKKISKDTPLAEITFRRYERPDNLSERDLVRKLCLSIGLLQPGDSRDVIVDILIVLLEAKRCNEELSSESIRENVIKTRENRNLPMVGIASSNIRRQIKRLRDVFIAEKIKNNYRITEFSKLSDIMEERVQQFLLPSILGRVTDYINEVDKTYFSDDDPIQKI